MNAIVQLGDALVNERNYEFKPYRLHAGVAYFPGMGITYLDEENIPLLLLPKNVSTSLKVTLLTFTIFNYCKEEHGAIYDPNLLKDMLVKTKEYVDVLYTMDCIYMNDKGIWEFNESLPNVVSIEGLTLEDLEELE